MFQRPNKEEELPGRNPVRREWGVWMYARLDIWHIWSRFNFLAVIFVHKRCEYCSLSGIIPSGINNVLLFQTSGRWYFIFNFLCMSFSFLGENLGGTPPGPSPYYGTEVKGEQLNFLLLLLFIALAKWSLFSLYMWKNIQLKAIVQYFPLCAVDTTVWIMVLLFALD